MRKLSLCLLALLLIVGVNARAESAAVRVVRYEDLGDLVVAAAPRYRADLRTLAGQEATLADLTRQHTALMSHWEMNIAQLTSIQTNIKNMRKRIEAAKAALPTAALRYTAEARGLYLTHFALSLDLEIAQRGLDTARAAHSTAQQKHAAGLMTQTALAATEETVYAREELVKAASRAVADNLTALADYLGLDEPIALSGLPEWDASRIALRDYETDLAAYLACNTTLISLEQAVQDAKDAYAEDDSHLNRHLLTVAKEDLDAGIAAATRTFSRTHEAMSDALEALNTATALPQAARALQTADALFRAGRLSKSALTAAQTAHADAAARHARQTIEVWKTYLAYTAELAED